MEFFRQFSVLSGMAAKAAPPEVVEEFLFMHCYDCHDDATQKGDLDLTDLEFDLMNPARLRDWVKVFDQAADGVMPPKKKKRPEPEELNSFLAALDTEIVKGSESLMKDGRSELRRLSRAEYANSLKDLLDLPNLEAEEKLPPDSLSDGFMKSSEALDFSHIMISRYLEVADYALWEALAKKATPQKKQTVRAELKSVDGVSKTLQTLFVQLKMGTAIPMVGNEVDRTMDVSRGNFGKRDPGYVKDPAPHFDGVATFMHGRDNHNVTMKPFKVKQSGFYKIRVHGWGMMNDYGKIVPSDRTETVSFYSKSGRLLGRCDLPPNVPTTSEVTVWLNEGEPVEYLASSTPNRYFKLGDKLKPYAFHHFKSNGIALQWFEMEGPLVDQWPPQSHRNLLGDLKLEPTPEKQPNGLYYIVKTDQPDQDAERLLRDFAEKALRRPVTDEDLEIPLMQTRARLAQNQPFVDSLMAGYRAILTSPGFLLMEEKSGTLDAWALATRLSFFLTNSPPDEELRALAANGDLLRDEVLRAQTDRLLDDPGRERFISHFLDYWLDLRKINVTEPDMDLYPEFNPMLSESMVEETRAFFGEMLAEDLGADHIIDSDFLTINQRTAALYGIDGVKGSEIQKVKIPEDSVRGGLLTQGSILKITANGTTTSPVVRGTFTLDRLLGDPAPPPPPSVPAIDPDISGATTVRDLLEKHREDPNCASCHAKIDPPGFALEAFDVMGGFREQYRAIVEDGKKGEEGQSNGKPLKFRNSLPIETYGELPDGSEFADVNEFRDRLREKEPEIARHLLGQFIVYGTGAPVWFPDRKVVNDMMARLAEDNYGVRSMIHEVVQSPLFRKK